MSKNKSKIDLSHWEEYMEEISETYGDDKLLEAGTEVVEESRKFLNVEIGKALKESKFHFKKGEGGSQGKTRESLIKVSQMPTEVVGKKVVGYAGIDYKEAPEGLILAITGSPSGAKDTQLSNAIRVKGKTKNHLLKLQGDIFTKYWRGLK